MKVLYDHQIFSSFAFGGVSRIYFELMNAYVKDPEIMFKLSLKYTDNEYLKDAGWITDVRPFVKRIGDDGNAGLPVRMAKNFIVKRMNEHRKAENRKHSEKIIARGEFDIFHPTYFDPYFLDSLKNKPFVLTVYDLIYELFPEYFPSSQKFLHGKALLVKKAAKIIAISENTKTDLMKYYNLPSGKIEVVYLANSLMIEPGIQNIKSEDVKLPERYLLYVGNRAIYKNFLFFVESIVPLLTRDKTLSVVCAGGKDFTQEERKIFSILGIEHNLCYCPVNDAILTSLYTNAVAFVFPSLYEGFGIPVLEAFACNCPVLISNTSSLPEIAGGACLSFDPKDKTSIFDAVKQILSNEFLRTELKKKGKERVKFFSWEKTAAETKRIYASVL
jgi:glycosyltransferase involved in cell wall biosynthesis